MALREIDPDIVPGLDQRLKKVGFVNVEKKYGTHLLLIISHLAYPLGSWLKRFFVA